MFELLIATHNKGKIKRYERLFFDIKNLKLITLTDLNINHKVDEPFATPRENSIFKAQEYAKLSQRPTIAIDEAAKTNFLPTAEQPGVFVRRFKNKQEMSDVEMLAVWKEIFARYPNAHHQFVWDFSLAYFNPENRELKTVSAVQVDKVALEFSDIIDPGYPMSSFLIPDGWSKTYSEMSEDELSQVDQKNLKPFIDLIKSVLE